MDEKALIKACQKKKPEAQKELFDKYAPLMMAVCRRYMACNDDAGESLQIGFIKVFECIDDYKFKGSFEGWMKRIIINTCISELRKSQNYRYHENVDDASETLTTKTENVYDKLGAEYLMELVSALPEGYRMVFNLYVIEGYSHKEIAEMCNITVSTSRSQLTKAKKILRGALADTEKESIK